MRDCEGLRPGEFCPLPAYYYALRPGRLLYVCANHYQDVLRLKLFARIWDLEDDYLRAGWCNGAGEAHWSDFEVWTVAGNIQTFCVTHMPPITSTSLTRRLAYSLPQAHSG